MEEKVKGRKGPSICQLAFDRAWLDLAERGWERGMVDGEF